MQGEKILVVKLYEYQGRTYYTPENDEAKEVLKMTADNRRKHLTQKDYDRLTGLGIKIKVLKPKVTYE